MRDAVPPSGTSGHGRLVGEQYAEASESREAWSAHRVHAPEELDVCQLEPHKRLAPA